MKRAPTFFTFVLFSLGLFVLVASSVLFSGKKPLVAIAAGEVHSATTTEQTYLSSDLQYMITYPSDFTVNSLYSYKPTGPEQAISGVSFTIPSSGTNLAPNSFLSVESLGTKDCSIDAFFGNVTPTSTQSIVDKGTAYTVAESSWGKRNHYEEYVYLLRDTHPCIAVRYFLHYTDMSIYTPGTVQEFNHDEVIAQLDTIRESLTLNQ